MNVPCIVERRMFFASTLINGSRITFQKKSQNDCHCIQNVFLVVNLA